MKVYVGYVMFDYATPMCIGLDRSKVQKYLNTNSYWKNKSKWIDCVELNGKEIVELECD